MLSRRKCAPPRPWQKTRVNKGQPFVVAGYTPSARNFDALVFGYFDGGLLMYAGRTRSGFTPASRDQIFGRFKGLETETCPFANLPEGKSGRWGEGLTAEKMHECRRLNLHSWASLSSSIGRRTVTCGIPGLWAVCRTRRRERWFGNRERRWRRKSEYDILPR